MPKSQPVPAKPAIQSDEEAGLEAQMYLNEKAAIDQIDALEVSVLAAVKESFAKKRSPHVARRDEHFARVRTWSESTRGVRKTIKFPNGREFRWRKASTPKLIVSGDLDSIVAALLRRRDWKKFLKFDLLKSILTAHPEVVEQIDGLEIERGEYVSIG